MIEQARDGIPEAWLEAARHSPVWKMAMEWKVAFPLHPEYRTLPMVWYVPPLSPIQAAAEAGKMASHGERHAGRAQFAHSAALSRQHAHRWRRGRRWRSAGTDARHMRLHAIEDIDGVVDLRAVARSVGLML